MFGPPCLHFMEQLPNDPRTPIAHGACEWARGPMGHP